MANPEHTPELDTFDARTVRLYRGAYLWITLGLVGCALGAAGRIPFAVAGWWTAVGVSLAVWNLHVYDKRFRWIIPGAAWVGWMITGLAGLVENLAGKAWTPVSAATVMDAGFGFHLVALSALALKEQLCFRVPMLRAVPLLLCVAILAHAAGALPVSAAAFIAAAVPVGGLAAVKLRQPLGFDIGDRSRYQI
jgi:uncharacterized integral membrane protein